ncbi:MAG: hypothetical protein JST48_14690 [Bacteroidetes bacterium]|nr:hypothetical protein [Bacteroidota bacterium]
MIFRIMLLGLLLFFSLDSYAQKIKYKDLIILLSSKQYEKAEPFLKRYLKDNDDNPNAFLYMGITFQEKALKNDPLLQTGVLFTNIDSALIYYDKAYKTIDEREIRKNDEYYEAYSRRDLRTGKFVIKLSDVQLDIENRSNKLKERKDKVTQLKNYLLNASGAYTRSQKIFTDLQQKYSTENDFLLQSTEQTLSILKKINIVFDSCTEAFNAYKSISKELGKTGHDQRLQLREIKDMKKEGLSEPDFLNDDLKIWDFKSWASLAISRIETEINPLRDQLVKFDIEMNKLRAKLQKDSVSVKQDVLKLLHEDKLKDLKKYDPNPMPIELFAMKAAELEYRSDVLVNKKFKDSADVKLQLTMIQTEVADIKKLDSVSSNLLKRNFETEEKNYGLFISKAFGKVEVLKNTISATQDFAQRERKKKEERIILLSKSLNWIVLGTDSIPLLIESAGDLKFRPLFVEPEKFTFGINYKDSTSTLGYFYSITPSRIPDIKVNYPVDHQKFLKQKFSSLKGIAASDVGSSTYITLIVSSEKVDEKFPASIAKIERATGLVWSVNIAFDLIPSELSINSDNGQVIVKTTAPDGASKIVTLDKKGKLIQ